MRASYDIDRTELIVSYLKSYDYFSRYQMRLTTGLCECLASFLSHETKARKHVTSYRCCNLGPCSFGLGLITRGRCCTLSYSSTPSLSVVLCHLTFSISRRKKKNYNIINNRRYRMIWERDFKLIITNLSNWFGWKDLWMSFKFTNFIFSYFWVIWWILSYYRLESSNHSIEVQP